MEFMLGFESLFGSDWQAESRVQGKLSEVGWSPENMGKVNFFHKGKEFN